MDELAQVSSPRKVTEKYGVILQKWSSLPFESIVDLCLHILEVRRSALE